MSGPDRSSGPGQEPGIGHEPHLDPEPRPGLKTFTLEGRAAPGLFLVGWLAVIMGAGVLIVASLSGLGPTIRLVLALVGLGLLSLGLVAGAGSQAMERKARAVSQGDGESHGAGVGVYAGPSPFLVLLAALPLSILLVTVVVGPLVGLGLDAGGPAAIFITVALQGIVYIALIRLLVVGPGSLSWRDMGIGGRPAGALVEDVAWGAVLAVPVIVATVLVAGVMLSILPAPDSPIPPNGGSTGAVFNFLAAVVIAPAGEELFFRGFATTAWMRSMSPRGTILRGALFFAAVHVLTVGGADFGDAAGRAAVAFVSRLPVAIALGLVFTRRRSLAAPIALHATYNGLLFLAQFAGG